MKGKVGKTESRIQEVSKDLCVFEEYVDQIDIDIQ